MKKPNFNFPIQNKHQLNYDGQKTGIIKRFLARQMAYSIFKEKSTHYQFAGWSGTLKKDYNMCLANKFQLMHWILHNAGYSCSVAQIIERCGISYKEHEQQEMSN